jgi:surface polysaccharide O-acyltransferase-like enzyme
MKKLLLFLTGKKFMIFKDFKPPPPPGRNKKGYLFITNTGYLNTLRVFATFAVIMIHVLTPISRYFSTTLAESELYISVILRNLGLWCVPIFVMVTGVLFLNPDKSITVEKILKRYFLRIVLAILIFGIPFCFMEILFNSDMKFSIRQIGLATLNAIQGKSWGHMWYLYMIAGLYLCIPMIKIFVNNASKNTVKYALIVLFIFTSLIPWLETVMPYRLGIYIPINSVYVFYLLFGYYIHYYNVSVKNSILLILMMLYLSFVILMPLNSDFISLLDGGRIILAGYNSPPVIMVTFAVFCICRQEIKSSKVIEAIAPMCFGIYLIHRLFINFLYKYLKLTPEKYPLIIIIVVVSILTIILSFSFSYFTRKIKILRRYIL